jgi:hypothetical protein
MFLVGLGSDGRGSEPGHLRNPRTQQERRLNSNHEYRQVEIAIGGKTYELRIRIRGKRSLGMLVEAWHDMPRETQRSWKRHRRTQYKVALC